MLVGVERELDNGFQTRAFGHPTAVISVVRNAVEIHACVHVLVPMFIVLKIISVIIVRPISQTFALAVPQIDQPQLEIRCLEII